MFGDLDWPLNASRGFVCISWACLPSQSWSVVWEADREQEGVHVRLRILIHLLEALGNCKLTPCQIRWSRYIPRIIIMPPPAAPWWAGAQGFIQAPFGGGNFPPKPRNFPPRIFGQLRFPRQLFVQFPPR